MHTTKQLEEWIDLYGQKLFLIVPITYYPIGKMQKILYKMFMWRLILPKEQFQEKTIRLLGSSGILQHKVSDYYKEKIQGQSTGKFRPFFDHQNFWKILMEFLKIGTPMTILC